MELINLRNHTHQYRTNTQIETALAWNAVKKFLIKIEREDLFKVIKGIKITEKNITIVVRSPLIKSELSLHKEALYRYLEEGLTETFASHKRNIRIL